MSGLTLVSEEWIGNEHQLAVWDVDLSRVVVRLGVLLRQMYAEPDALRDSLSSAMEGIGEVTDPRVIQSILDEVVEAVVPVPTQRDSQPWLELTRNEAGEVLAYYAAEVAYGAAIVSRLAHKEVPQLPARGMDLLGIGDDGEIFLLAGEVKSSDSEASPPGVVGVGDTSLRAQLATLAKDREKILRELSWSHKHGDKSARERVAKALLLHAMNRLPVRIFPVLVRPAGRHGRSDFGCFSTEAATFLPQHIRFCLLRLPCSLEEFASLIYGEARSHAS